MTGVCVHLCAVCVYACVCVNKGWHRTCPQNNFKLNNSVSHIHWCQLTASLSAICHTYLVHTSPISLACFLCYHPHRQGSNGKTCSGRGRCDCGECSCEPPPILDQYNVTDAAGNVQTVYVTQDVGLSPGEMKLVSYNIKSQNDPFGRTVQDYSCSI